MHQAAEKPDHRTGHGDVVGPQWRAHEAAADSCRQGAVESRDRPVALGAGRAKIGNQTILGRAGVSAVADAHAPAAIARQRQRSRDAVAWVARRFAPPKPLDVDEARWSDDDSSLRHRELTLRHRRRRRSSRAPPRDETIGRKNGDEIAAARVETLPFQHIDVATAWVGVQRGEARGIVPASATTRVAPLRPAVRTRRTINDSPAISRKLAAAGRKDDGGELHRVAAAETQRAVVAAGTASERPSQAADS